MSDYIKVKDLVGKPFTIKGVGRYVFKSWDAASSKMLTSELYQLGYRKMYAVDTDKGPVDMSSSQLQQCLEAVQSEGKADVVGKTFTVKTNGKDGTKEVRYFFNSAGSRPIVKDDQPPIENYDEGELPF